MKRVVVTGMGIVSSIGNTTQEVLASLRSDRSADGGESSPVPSWPVHEDLDVSTGIALSPTDDGDNDDDGYPVPDEHFVPPAPPPLPKLRPATVLAVLAILVGMAMLVTSFDGGDLDVLAVLAIVGGAGSLVWHMRQGPPTDSGWDDGAVL